MLSALIQTKLSYPAMRGAQLAHQRFVLSGPLVLGKGPCNSRRPQQIGDRQFCYFAKPHQYLFLALWRVEAIRPLYVAIQVGLYLLPSGSLTYSL